MSVVYLKFSRVFLKGNICGGGSQEVGKEEAGELQFAGCGCFTAETPSSRVDVGK